jgi:predicted membrane metal-binding protein
MIRLPRVVVSCAVAANVADNRDASALAVIGVVVSLVVSLFVFCPSKIPELLYALPVGLTAALITKPSAI